MRLLLLNSYDVILPRFLFTLFWNSHFVFKYRARSGSKSLMNRVNVSTTASVRDTFECLPVRRFENLNFLLFIYFFFYKLKELKKKMIGWILLFLEIISNVMIMMMKEVSFWVWMIYSAVSL